VSSVINEDRMNMSILLSLVDTSDDSAATIRFLHLYTLHIYTSRRG